MRSSGRTKGKDPGARRRALQQLLGAGALALAAREAAPQSRGMAERFAAAGPQGAQGPLHRLPRHALVIGNSRYKGAPLRNPGNDAAAIAAQLKAVGFEVVHALDAGRAAMLEAIEAYGRTLEQKGAVGLFYFAGHGVQLAWRNYLIPVDATIESPDDVRDRAVELNALLQGLRRAKNPMNVIILDACRDNPFGSRFAGAQKGLSQFDAPPGSLLAYSTAPGNVASDGEGEHSLYTENLVRELGVAEARIEDVFKRVRLHVRRRTNGRQIPWESTSLEDDFYFIPPKSLAKLDASVAQGSRRDFLLRVSQIAQAVPRIPKGNPVLDRLFEEQLATWDRIQHSNDPEPLVEFLLRYPSGWFAELAELRLDQVLERQGERKIAIQSSPDNPFSKGSGSMNTAYRVGDMYSYREMDIYTRQHTGDVVSVVTKIGESEIFFGDGRVTDLLGNVLVSPGRFIRSHNQITPREFSVGKRWSTRFNVTGSTGNLYVQDFSVRVADRERVTVPAGTFNAFRVEAKGWGIGPQVNFFHELTRWYAPDHVRHPVATENLTQTAGGSVRTARRQELVAFKQQIAPNPGAVSR